MDSYDVFITALDVVGEKIKYFRIHKIKYFLTSNYLSFGGIKLICVNQIEFEKLSTP